MQAIILAGGEGRRLRPLTEDRPKPLIPLLDEPAAGYGLHLLRRHGFREATLAVGCGAEQIRACFGDGSAYRMSVDYAAEDAPLGTAGSVRHAARAGETVLVMCGDVLTDCDLSAMITAHRRSGAAATVALAETDHPAEYGLCDLDAQGRITRFVEKPGSAAPPRGLVSTGICLLEPLAVAAIPQRGAWDFGRDVFPRMAVEGSLAGWVMRGYWRDIGCVEQYAQAQHDLLMGRVGLPVRGQRRGRAIVGQGARISPGARITGRCYIGEGAVIGAGAVVGEGAVISRGAVVTGGVRISHACLFPGVRAEGEAILRGVAILPGAEGGAQRIPPYRPEEPPNKKHQCERGLTAEPSLHIMWT